MNHEEYNLEKARYSHKLYKEGKLFKKARAIIFDNKELLVIQMNRTNGVVDYYVPGGGVDDGETLKDAVIRESFEEYGAIVKPIKMLSKKYYNVPMTYNGENFMSRRVEYYYICQLLRVEDGQFGIAGEFTKKDRTYKKTKLTIEQVKKLNPYYLNKMNDNIFQSLVKYMDTL